MSSEEEKAYGLGVVLSSPKIANEDKDRAVDAAVADGFVFRPDDDRHDYVFLEPVRSGDEAPMGFKSMSVAFAFWMGLGMPKGYEIRWVHNPRSMYDQLVREQALKEAVSEANLRGVTVPAHVWDMMESDDFKKNMN